MPWADAAVRFTSMAALFLRFRRLFAAHLYRTASAIVMAWARRTQRWPRDFRPWADPGAALLVARLTAQLDPTAQQRRTRAYEQIHTLVAQGVRAWHDRN